VQQVDDEMHAMPQHRLPLRQSPLIMQPQAPLKHAFPAALLVQSTQTPLEPHAVVAVPL
jgi:hypothetical protein